MSPARSDNESPRDFLFEIGTEELPAAAARSAAEQAGALSAAALVRHHIDTSPENIAIWVTPRRIAVFIKDLAPMQQTQEIVERGPIAAKAFDEEGKPTKAAMGFAKAKGIDVSQLETREHDGQQFVFAVHSKEGLPIIELLPQICDEILHGINFPKTMRWNGSGLRFSRPVRWLVAKYGSETVEFESAGLRSGGFSRGHRFLASNASVEITEAGGYREQLKQAYVTVDQEERRESILAGLAVESGKLGASFIDPAGELEEVLYLVENPSVHAGDFAEEHLRLPGRVLTTCMQSHQRYFPLTAEDGALAAGFLYVMNGDPASAAGITEGNERVLEGRIEDAEFSFDKDLKTGIEAMASALGNVVFHRKLGTLADKTARLQTLVEVFAGLLGLDSADLKTALAAARLAKADQVSIMVQEFADLEGYIGSVYANLEGFPSDVCKAIEEHFLPTSSGGVMPSTLPGAVLAIADKADNIMGAFAVEEVPTGSRDPYGIRRAAAGLAAISAGFSFDFDLEALLAAAHRLFMEQKADVAKDASLAASAREFIFDRIQNRLAEEGVPVELVEAARAAAPESTLRLEALTTALNAFRTDPSFEDYHTAYFRCTKIAAKAGAELEHVAVDESLFEADTERQLFREILDLEPVIEQHVESMDYTTALGAAAGIRAAVDRFFDDVMVMAEDERVRNNRLALVLKVAAVLRRLGDPMRAAAAPREEP